MDFIHRMVVIKKNRVTINCKNTVKYVLLPKLLWQILKMRQDAEPFILSLNANH